MLSFSAAMNNASPPGFAPGLLGPEAWPTHAAAAGGGAGGDYQPWLCTIVASLAVGLAGIVPLAFIPEGFDAQAHQGEYGYWEH